MSFSTLKRYYDKDYDIMFFYTDHLMDTNTSCNDDGIMIWKDEYTKKIVQIAILDFMKRLEPVRDIIN